MTVRSCLLVLTLFPLLAPVARSAEPARFEFTTLVAHWANYAEEGYLPFVLEARPDVAQLGFYGGHFWSLAHTPQYKGYPAHFPAQGLAETGAWFEEKNGALEKAGIKVVGHFNVEFLVGDPESDQGPRGFFKFYRDLWDEKELGPKPVKDPIELLERDADGKPIVNNSYSIGGMKEYWGCLRNPHWRAVLKAWTKRGIERGVDGYIANYFYRHNCLCEHCQRGFRDYLAKRFTADELRERFQIANVQQHEFAEIVAWHNPAESTPLRREMLRFSQITNKQAFDEVFIEYGRSLKPDLLVAQWNHLSRFSQINGDERCLLPAEMWGRDETYLWYSLGAAGNYTNLKEGDLGEGTLQARYIRGAFDDKPFTLGKYENTRIRVAIAELAANGGAPMGFYTRFGDPEAREVIVRYYRFLRKHDKLFRAARPYSEAVLLYPRSAVHAGNIEPVAQFKRLGQELLNDHMLFDVLPDDIATDEQLASYRYVFATSTLVEADPQPNEEEPQEEETARETIEAAADVSPATTIEAPATVRVSASRSAAGNDLLLHLVNYNRVEPPLDRNGKPSPGRGIKDEQPIAVSGVKVKLSLPAGKQAGSVRLLTPEAAEPIPLKHQQAKGQLQLTVPEFLVYAVIHCELVDAK